MKKAAWKVIILSLPVLALCIYYLSSWIPLAPIAYRHVFYWWEEKTKGTPKKWEAKHLRYLENLKAPKVTSKEIVALLKEEKIIKTQELYDIVNWYVNMGDEDVIRQVIANRRYEMDVNLPEERPGKSSWVTCVAKGDYLVPLFSSYTDDVLRVYHHELQSYAAKDETDPRFIYFLMRQMPKNSRDKWYFEQVFHDDILSFLRIYVNYKDWPTIRKEAKRRIIEYRCGWLDWDSIDEVLKIAAEKGAEPAYKLYMQRYHSNYRRFSGEIADYNDRKKKYKYESIYKGWCSENVMGLTRIYNVDSDNAIIGIRNVEEIISVLRDGEDITKLCNVTSENVMTAPLKPADTIEIKYTVKVAPGWWKRYKGMY